jgi:hypothetical protein
MISLLADHNFREPILRGLLLRVPGLGVVTARSAGLAGAPDPDVLAWAAAYDRVVLTHDRQTMAGFAYARVAAGEPMTGLIVAESRAAIRRVIDDLELICVATIGAEWVDRVEFIPY